MKSHHKQPKPEKNSVQYLRHLLEQEKKENKEKQALIERLQFDIDNLKKQNDKLSEALAGKITDEGLKNLALKALKRKETKQLDKEKKKEEKKEGGCPKCGGKLTEIKKADGNIIVKCLSCRRK